MSLVEINWSPNQKQISQFGVLCLLILPLLGWLWRVSSTTIIALFAIASVIAFLAYFRPLMVRPLYVGLILFTAPIGFVVSELAMVLIYFAIFLPISLSFRLVQRDALKLKIDRGATTYWQSKPQPKDISSYYRRY